ncbi:MAG: inorganic phosphate transporter [Candidatus Omnitrophica bacterium]|nr:inorganic phosphate transporter [Candidatus Omnitrophota bacterium]
MSVFLIAATVLMGAGVGWSIGANDAANSLGTAVGSKIITLRQAIFLIAVMGFLGAYFMGGNVTKTIGKGIVPLNQLDKDISMYVALTACFGACAWVVIATYWKMPVSTSHSIIGAVAGAGLAVGAPISWKVLFDVFKCWIMTPVGAMVLGYVFYAVFQQVFYRFVPRRLNRPIMAVLVILSGCYVAFSWGANDVANSVGVISGAGILSHEMALLIGGAAIVLGIVTWGYKVIETVGSEITSLLPIMAFSAQLASAVNVHIYTNLGVPVSTSHSIVGAIMGVGLLRGVKVVNMKIAREMMFCWLATPFVSGIIGFIVIKTVMFFAGLKN